MFCFELLCVFNLHHLLFLTVFLMSVVSLFSKVHFDDVEKVQWLNKVHYFSIL